MNKKMLIIVGGVVLLLGGGGAGLYFSGYFEEETAEAAEPVVLEPGVLDLDPFLTNIHDPGGQRAARLQVKLVIAPVERVAEIQADALLMAQLRDHILKMLTAKTYEELNSPDGKETFRSEMNEQLAELIETGELRQVLFSDFIVQ